MTGLALEYANNHSLLNEGKPDSRKEKDTLQQCEAYVWGSNSSHQLGEQLQDKVMSCKKSRAFDKAYQVDIFMILPF